MKELYEWVKDRPLEGIESLVRREALTRYYCTDETAVSYAQAVRRMVQEARKVAPVQRRPA